MKRILIGLSIAVALVVTGPMNPLTASQNEASARIIKDCSFAFISLPLRGFYYPPANETKNVGRLIVEEDGDGERNGTVTYEFNGLPPNSLATIWWVNLFMMTRQGAFPGFAPPSPQGNPYKGWTSGTAGPGYDTNGDGIILCGEGLPSFPPGSMYTKYQSPAFDQNAFCTDENGHSKAIITFPYDPTLTTIPAQIPPLLQTEVVPLKLVDGVFKLFNVHEQDVLAAPGGGEGLLANADEIDVPVHVQVTPRVVLFLGVARAHRAARKTQCGLVGEIHPGLAEGRECASTEHQEAPEESSVSSDLGHGYGLLPRTLQRLRAGGAGKLVLACHDRLPEAVTSDGLL